MTWTCAGWTLLCSRMRFVTSLWMTTPPCLRRTGLLWTGWTTPSRSTSPTQISPSARTRSSPGSTGIPRWKAGYIGVQIHMHSHAIFIFMHVHFSWSHLYSNTQYSTVPYPIHLALILYIRTPCVVHTYVHGINLACSVCVLYLKHTALSSHTCLHFLVNLPCCRYCCCVVWGELLCQWKSGPVLQTAPLPPSHPRVELLGPHPPCGTYVRMYSYIHACVCVCVCVCVCSISTISHLRICALTNLTVYSCKILTAHTQTDLIFLM